MNSEDMMLQFGDEQHLPSPPPDTHDVSGVPRASSQLKACESCRKRKIRCTGPADSSYDGSCAKCLRYNRECLYRARIPAKRQKRVDVRVRELEQKIQDLADRLHNPGLPTTSSSDQQSDVLQPYILSDSDDELKSFDSVSTAQGALEARNTRIPTTKSPGEATTNVRQNKLWRKSTIRSINGCQPCRKRKLKCDESQPSCDRCNRNARECTYKVANIQLPRAEEWRYDQSAGSELRFEHFFSALETLGPMLGIDSSHVDHRVYRLLTHWEIHTAKTFGAPHMAAVMTKWSFEMASKFPFLLHAMCAITLLHLQYLEGHPRDEHTTCYDYHFERGLELYTMELSKPLNLKSMDAIFAACMLFAMMAYQTSVKEPGQLLGTLSTDADSCVDELAWLTSQCGFLTLKTSPAVRPHLPQSIWHELLSESDNQGHSLTQPLDIAQIPAEWRLVCEIDEHTNSDNNPYYDALKLVLLMEDIDATKPENFSSFICFPGRMKPKFRNLVLSRDPVALLLVSHWLAKMCEMEQWFCRERVIGECYAICTRLDLEMGEDPAVQALLETPKRACGYVSVSG